MPPYRIRSSADNIKFIHVYCCNWFSLLHQDIIEMQCTWYLAETKGQGLTPALRSFFITWTSPSGCIHKKIIHNIAFVLHKILFLQADVLKCMKILCLSSIWAWNIPPFFLHKKMKSHLLTTPKTDNHLSTKQQKLPTCFLNLLYSIHI